MPGTAEPSRLVLFDIDGTLLDTGGAGLTSIAAAAEEHFASRLEAAGGVPPLDLAGSTDAGIVRSLYTHFGELHSPVGETAFYRSYLRHLGTNLGDPKFGGAGLLGGTADLLAALAATPGVTLALLTGNIQEGAFLKVGHYGVRHYFTTGGFGDDHHDRNLLGPIAIRRASQAAGRRFTPETTTVIGDTPKDIRCARACGARAVAVATGKFTREELGEHSPDGLWEDFSKTSQVVADLLAH